MYERIEVMPDANWRVMGHAQREQEHTRITQVPGVVKMIKQIHLASLGRRC